MLNLGVDAAAVLPKWVDKCQEMILSGFTPSNLT